MSTIEVIFLTSSAACIAGGCAVLFSNPSRTINRVYVITAILAASWLISASLAAHAGARGDHREAHVWIRVLNAFGSFLPWSCGLITIAIMEAGTLGHVIKRSVPWFGAGIVLLMLVYSEGFLPAESTSAHDKRGIAYSIYVTSLGASCLFVLYNGYTKMRISSGIQQLELKFFLINSCSAILLVLVSFAASNLFHFLPLRYAGPFIVVASFGLTVWAICYHRIFDARQVFASLGRRLSTLIVLAGTTAVIHRYLAHIVDSSMDIALSASCGALMAAYWDRKLCTWVDLNNERKLVAPRTRITEWAREETDTAKMVAKFESFLRDWCQTESVKFHSADNNAPLEDILKTSNYGLDYPLLRQVGYVTIETIERRRPDPESLSSTAVLKEQNAAALVIVPRGSHSPSCLVSFGYKHSLRPYTYPDMQLLIELVELMDNILTHSRAAARAAQIEKMESAAMMSRGLAHDLNNLATPVSTFLLHMENRVAPNTLEAEVLADAKHSIRVMQDYIRESLFFARRLVPNFEPLSIKVLCTNTVQAILHRAQARDVRVVVAEEDDVRFKGDRVLLQRLLQNLVLNAIDATPRGGTVTLSAAADSNGRAMINVVDEGQGIPAEIRDRIFEPYFTTKDTGSEVRGMGLGLAICLKISDLHGGTLTATNTSSGGAAFTVALPINPKAPASSADSKPPVPGSNPTPAEFTSDSTQAARCRPPSPI